MRSDDSGRELHLAEVLSVRERSRFKPRITSSRSSGKYLQKSAQDEKNTRRWISEVPSEVGSIGEKHLSEVPAVSCIRPVRVENEVQLYGRGSTVWGLTHWFVVKTPLCTLLHSRREVRSMLRKRPSTRRALYFQKSVQAEKSTCRHFSEVPSVSGPSGENDVWEVPSVVGPR